MVGGNNILMKVCADVYDAFVG